MKSIGIICEYNPFHNGHQRQIQLIRQHFGQESTIVCLMSGNYVQRGAPAIFDKSLRAQAAIQCGADLVLELPIGTALSSAEGFAAGGVSILSGICDCLCFGTETLDEESLLQIAQSLLSPVFIENLKAEMKSGCSFPAARQSALKIMGITQSLSNPNDLLGVEYTKAILAQNSNMQFFPIQRQGAYHSTVLNADTPSATALRKEILSGGTWCCAVPSEAFSVMHAATPHTMEAGERAILYRLRTMSDEEFEVLPYGSEGLWRKLMKAARTQPDLSAVIDATKSKRYTRTRIDRMILCAFLGLTAQDLATPAPYTRILAFNSRGRDLLSKAKHTGLFLNVGARFDHPYWDLEAKCTDLYSLFTSGAPDPPGQESRYRIFYRR